MHSTYGWRENNRQWYTAEPLLAYSLAHNLAASVITRLWVTAEKFPLLRTTYDSYDAFAVDIRRF